MSAFAIERSDIIKNTYIDIHKSSINESLWSPDFHFATLTLEITDTPPIKSPQHILFTEDISGSMSDLCQDGREKMQHAIHTTKNIIDVFSKDTETDISVEIVGFDDRIKEIVPRTKCNLSTRDKIHNDIVLNMQPRDNTNFEIALENANSRMALATEIFKTHIFMTDGNVSRGIQDPQALTDLVNESFPNIFIGFGIDHDASLMQRMAKKSGCSYYYIDQIENAGLAYGEIIHEIIYKALHHVTITVTNGEIYNFQTNTWSTQLFISSLVGEANKTYHLRTTTPDDICAIIHAASAIHEEIEPTHLEDIDVLPGLIFQDPETEEVITIGTDLTKYMYRQRTLELLYEAQQQEHQQQYQQQISNSKEFHKKMKLFLENMNTYMQENGFQDDDFMKSLCDDISITINAMKSSKLCATYSGARARSNGNQGCWRITPSIYNQHSYSGNNNDNNDNDEDPDCIQLSQPCPLNRTNTTGRQYTMMENITNNELSSILDTKNIKISAIVTPVVFDLQN